MRREIEHGLGPRRASLSCGWARPNLSCPSLALALALAVALGLSGCGDDEPARVEGSAQTLSGTYAVGQNVRIVSPNGAVSVRRGSSSGELTAVFRPFVDDAVDSEQAVEAMASSLALGVDDGGNTIIVSATILPGAPAGLGADLEIALPTSFAGGFEIQQGGGLVDADLEMLVASYTSVQSTRGDVTVRGARGQLDVTVQDGACDLRVADWSTSNGAVELTTGSLALFIAPALSGRLDAQAGTDGTGQIRPPSPLPTDWTEEVVEPGHSRFAFGADAALMGTVSLRTAASGSVIALSVEPSAG